MPAAEYFNRSLQIRLEERKRKDLYRELCIQDGKIDFCSNDYLGLARLASPDLQPGGLPGTGATGSRLISGHSEAAEKAEEIIAAFHSAEASLIFNCGYMANIGLLSSIGRKGDTFIVDANVHASIHDGIRLSHAGKYKFRHNDPDDLEKKIKKAQGNTFVVVESLYSMDGDRAPLPHIAEICARHKALLIVDEAHATGIWGENGKGLVSNYQLPNGVFACIHTFGKAMGLHGAAVTGSLVLKNYLINFGRSFIYSTALPPATYKQILNAYQLLPSVDRSPLFDLIDYFRGSIRDLKLQEFTDSQSQIQSLVIGSNTRAKALSEHLFQNGIHAKAILSPTVAPGTERIRICLHSFNTKHEVDLLLTEIRNFLK